MSKLIQLGINSENLYPNTIVEEGSNVNGTYTKYADGTLICKKQVTFTSVPVNNNAGAMYASATLALGDYAMPFTGNIPDVTKEVVYNNGRSVFCLATNIRDTITTLAPIQFAVLVAGTVSSIILNIKAEGKWK